MGIVPDDHDRDEDASYMELRVEFFEGDEKDDEGEAVMHIGQMESHYHKVPPSLVVDSYLVLAREIVVQGMIESMFAEGVPEQVRRMAAKLMATQWLQARLNDPNLRNTDPIENPVIPDDASSLMEGDNA